MGRCEDPWEIVSLLIAYGADMHAKNVYGETPLMFAVHYGNVATMEMILSLGANVTEELEAKTTSEGGTVLHDAVNHNIWLPTVRPLLDNGAAVNAKNFRGETPLHHSRSLEITEEMLHRGANIFERDDDNRTPFDSALARNRPVVYHCIFQHYRDLIVEAHERLSLHAILKETEYVVVEERRIINEIVRLKMASLSAGKSTFQRMHSLLQSLLSQHPDWIYAQDSDCSIPLHIVCQKAGDAPIGLVHWLVEQDVPTLYYGDAFGRLPLHVASHARAPASTIQYLVEKGGVGTLCARDCHGSMPLHSMVSRFSTNSTGSNDNDKSPPPKLDALEYLIKLYPKSVTERNNTGQLPIMLACQSSAPEEVLYVLLKSNPDSVAYMIDYYNSTS